ncbi:dTDP-glucose 4,6-dehydratase-like isoform X2 [Daphnia carinata]|nr:dTDP-glucose 4,6-dehydratase-like isoform X2 [Daphnia carinata]
MSKSDVKPRVLILGGCGFVGRHLVSFLVNGELASHVRIVDKVPPPMAWLNDYHLKAFNSPIVEFKSANLLNTVSRENAFSTDDNNKSAYWDFVINLAAETKHNQTRAVYEQGTVPLSVGCAALAAKHQVKRYVEMSDSHCYSGKKKPAQEDDPVEPYTLFAECKMEVEKELRQIDQLDYVILRPAIIYGVGDRVGLTPWLILGAIYRHLGETLQLLWHNEVHNNTVHVIDVCRAIWQICNSNQVTSGQVFHVSDDADTTLGDLADIIADLFEIKYKFVGKMLSTLAKLDLKATAEDANDKHLPPWAEICQSAGISNTPLSPYATVENISGRNLWLDNSKLRDKLNFEISVPKPTIDLLKEVLDDFVSMNLFPALDK